MSTIDNESGMGSFGTFQPAFAGLVLAGGKSRRMGTDKTTIKRGQTTWLESAVSRLTNAGLEVAVSVAAEPAGSDQPEAVSEAEPAETEAGIMVIADRPEVSGRGPLTGILSAHLSRPEVDWLVLAVDLPDANLALLNRLTTAYRQRPAGTLAVCFAGPKDFEPLCAVYTARLLQEVVQKILSPDLKHPSNQSGLHGRNGFAWQRPSPRQLLAQAGQWGRLVLLSPSTQESRALTNYNHPGDLTEFDQRGPTA